VTKFTMQTFPQTQVWGGNIVFGSDDISDATAATAAFYSKVTDPKAAMIMVYSYVKGMPINSAFVFYDAPTPPPGIFDAFLAIPNLKNDVSTKSFLSLIKSFNTRNKIETRAIFDTFSLTSLTPSILDAVANETIFWGNKLSKSSGFISSYAMQPFLSSIYTHNLESSSTAFPPERPSSSSSSSSSGVFFLPSCIFFAWTNETFDQDFHEAARSSAKTISDIAAAQRLSEGGHHQEQEQEQQQSLHHQDDVPPPSYPNYAMIGTPLKDIYGSNLPKLQSLRAEVDPHNVMGLAGGWKI